MRTRKRKRRQQSPCTTRELTEYTACSGAAPCLQPDRRKSPSHQPARLRGTHCASSCAFRALLCVRMDFRGEASCMNPEPLRADATEPSLPCAPGWMTLAFLAGTASTLTVLACWIDVAPTALWVLDAIVLLACGSVFFPVGFWNSPIPLARRVPALMASAVEGGLYVTFSLAALAFTLLGAGPCGHAFGLLVLFIVPPVLFCAFAAFSGRMICSGLGPGSQPT